MYDAFAHFYQQKFDSLLADNSASTDSTETSPSEARYLWAAKQLREAERSALMTVFAQHYITQEAFRRLEHELDLVDLRGSGAQAWHMVLRERTTK
jgi:hypothetical protein